MADADRNIHAFMHCRGCMEELPVGESPREFARLSVGFTAIGLQVVCVRHDLNVVHVDFEGHRHPADTTDDGGFGGRAEGRVN